MNGQFNRRQLLRTGVAVAGVGLATGALKLSAQETANANAAKPVRLGMVGLGPRGRGLLQYLVSNHPGVTVTALCELDRSRLDAGIALVKKITGATPVGYCRGQYEYRNMFERPDLDGIVVATDVQVLAPIAIDGMKAGKHVAAEVSGVYTLDDCWGIVEEKERSGKHYMLLEECCYDDVNLMILGMIKRGLFGEPYYAECSYVHDIKVEGAGKPRFVTADQELTWRGRMMAEGYGNSYAPHGIASAAKLLGVNDGDRFESCSAMMSDPREIHAQMVELFGADSKAAKIKFQTGDFHSTLIRTVKGKMIRLDYSLSNTRPYSRYYVLQGMKGCYDSRSGIYVRGDRREAYPPWTPIDEFLNKYRHPWWSKEGEKATKVTTQHGGMDYFCLADFVDVVRNDHEPWIDCYDTAAYNALNHCSQLSIDRKGAAVEIPDFTKGKWKDPDWRKGRPGPAAVI